MVAGRPARELFKRRGPPAASMDLEDPAQERKGESRGRTLTALGKDRDRGLRGGHSPTLRYSGRGRWERRRTGPLGGGCPEATRLSAADGGLRAELQPGAHVRAWLSPSSLRAPAGSVPSPQPAPLWLF